MVDYDCGCDDYLYGSLFEEIFMFVKCGEFILICASA